MKRLWDPCVGILFLAVSCVDADPPLLAGASKPRISHASDGPPADVSDRRSDASCEGAPDAVAHVTPSKLAICPAQASTSIEFRGNLDSTAHPTDLYWKAGDPRNTSNFSTSLVIHGPLGWQGNLSVYFCRREAGQTCDYHAVLGGQEVGSGTLEFANTGALKRHQATQPLIVPAMGEQPSFPIQLNLGSSIEEGGDGWSGMTMLPQSSSMTYLHVTGGKTGRIQADCEAAPPSGLFLGETCGDWSFKDPPLPFCAARQTSWIQVAANLSSETPILAVPWNPNRPKETSNLSVVLPVFSAEHLTSLPTLHFRKDVKGQWSYHILLEGGDRMLPLADGILTFNANGALRTNSGPSEFLVPDARGELTRKLAIHLGPTRDEDGSGVDGLTSFPTGTVVYAVDQDGEPGFVGCACPEKGDLADRRLRIGDLYWGSAKAKPCEGNATRYVQIRGNLDVTAPIEGGGWDSEGGPSPSRVAVSSALFNGFGQAFDVAVSFRHVDTFAWEYRLRLGGGHAAVTLAQGTLQFDTMGVLVEGGGSWSVRLPLPDGIPGPALWIDMGIPIGGFSLTSFAADSNAQLGQDGTAPSRCAP